MNSQKYIDHIKSSQKIINSKPRLSIDQKMAQKIIDLKPRRLSIDIHILKNKKKNISNIWNKFQNLHVYWIHLTKLIIIFNFYILINYNIFYFYFILN